MYDLIIVGASAAGVSAGIYAARRKLNFLMVAKDIGGEVATSGEIGNWPGVIQTDGITLAGQFRAHIESYGVKPVQDVTIEKIEKNGNRFTVSGKRVDGKPVSYEAKAVIVTTGVHPRELNVPGEKEFRGKGVTYCTVCDGPLFGGKVTTTIGGGNSALESAIMMAGIAKKVYVVNINPTFRGDATLIEKVVNAPNIEVLSEAETTSIKGNGFVSGLTYRDKKAGVEKNLEVQGVMVHIGMIPNSDLVPTEVTKDQFKQIVVNEFAATNIPGLFAAGDVTNVPYKQIVVAAGQGVTAALSAVDYLNKLKE
ncbi:MAG: FAD-dependent oxidoreductase [Parcubacteria group bacterium]|nr:FAD-dependent oxidoreductase [Parcubacteria group bacterium]